MTDSVAANVEQWTQTNAEFTDAAAERAWSRSEITWGVFKIPESAVDALGDVNGLDVVELGCGTAFFSSWLVRRGARPVAVDPTPAQLATARRMQEESGIVFPLVEAPGEAVPLPAASFDLALSDYGASLWADPYAWIPEAARLLREHGFEILKLIEVEPPADAVAVEAYDYVPAAWATRWPTEEIWTARKR